ncbi:unnamed protein product [Closterium sp. NIES-54]
MSLRAERALKRALSMESLDFVRSLLHNHQPGATPLARPNGVSRGVLEFSARVQAFGKQGESAPPPHVQFLCKSALAPFLCVEAMLLEWMAEPRVGVLMDLGSIRSRLLAILCTATVAAAVASSSPAPAAAAAAAAAVRAASSACSCCWRCSSSWAAYRRAVSFVAFLVLVARWPRLDTMWKAHVDGYIQHGLPSLSGRTGGRQAGGERMNAHAEGRRGAGEKDSASVGQLGQAAMAVARRMRRRPADWGGSMDECGVNLGKGDLVRCVNLPSTKGTGGSGGVERGGCREGRNGKDVEWRERLKGRVWERYVDGMGWILEHGGGEGRELRCSHCSEGGSSSGGGSSSSGGGNSSSSSSGGGGGGGGSSGGGSSIGSSSCCNSSSLEGKDIPKGMYSTPNASMEDAAIEAATSVRLRQVGLASGMHEGRAAGGGGLELAASPAPATRPPAQNAAAVSARAGSSLGRSDSTGNSDWLNPGLVPVNGNAMLSSVASDLRLRFHFRTDVLQGQPTGKGPTHAPPGSGSSEGDCGGVWEEVQSWFVVAMLPGDAMEGDLKHTGGRGSACDSSGKKRKGKKVEEAAYLKAWPGGVNLVACLREMLLGEPCYRLASDAARSTSAAVSTRAASSVAAPIYSAIAAPYSDESTTVAALSTSAADVSTASVTSNVEAAGAAACGERVCSATATQGSGPAPSRGRVCGAAGCGRVKGGGVKLKSCGGCGKVAYCSRDCQKAHWPSHKLTCPGRTNGKRRGENGDKVSGRRKVKVKGSGTKTGEKVFCLYLPSFSTNLVSGADLQDQGVDQFTPASQRVTHCTCARTGQHLATFTRRPGSSLYTLTTESPPVAASGQVSASSQVFAAASRSGPESAPCSCRLLSHQTLLWHHRLGHPSLPRLRGMASRVLVSGLPRYLPPLPPGPAPTCVPCVEVRQRAAPHSSEFPPTEAPLQTLHMDVWGPARVRGQGHERYFLLVVDDYSRYTTVFPLRSKGDVTEVLIDWIRAACLHLRESFGSDFPVLRLHSNRGGEFSSARLGAFYRAQGIRQTFTLPASPQQNGIAERRIGMVMDVARTSMIHAAAPHFLWPFAVQYAAHQLNLQPRVSLPETSPTLRWTGKVGDASAFRVWGSRAFVRDLSADKLPPHAVPCVFLGFPPNAPGWQFYHPTSRRVLSSQDVTFDESVPYYRLFPYRTAPLPPPPLFLAPGPPPVDPLPPQGPAPSGVSQVDAVEPVEVAVDSGAARGAEPAGAGSGGAVPVGAEFGGAESRGAEPGGAASGGAEPGGSESGGAEPGGAEPGGAGSARVASRGTSSRRELLSPQELREWFARRWSRAAGAGGTTGAAGPGGTCTGGTGVAGTGGAAGTVGGGPAGGAAGAAGGTGATGPAGTGAAGATGAGAAGGVGAGGSAGAGASEGAGVDAVGARGATGAGAAAGDTGAVPAGSGGATRPRPYFVPLLEQVLGLPPSTGPAPPLACPQPVHSLSQLQPASPLPVPSPYTGPTGGLAERREPESRPASPVRTARTSRCALRQRPLAVPGTHQMALRPSTAPQRVPLPSPPESSLPDLADPESDSLRAASPTATRLLATVVTDPSFESTVASALVAELVDFAARCRLGYAASLVAASESVCPPSVGGECALSTDVLEDRQEEFQCFAFALPHLVSTLLAHEGDPDAPDIPTPRSYAEAIEGPYSS